MPRYKVSDVDVAELLARLSWMAEQERMGVLSGSVRIGISEAAAPDLAAAFRRAWSSRGDLRLHGRRVTFETVSVAEESRMFAMLFAARWNTGDRAASRSDGTGQGIALGAPNLFPLAPLQGTEDPNLVRGLFASRTDQAAALLRNAPADAVLVADEEGRSLLESAAATTDQVRPVGTIEDLPVSSATIVMVGPTGWRQLAARQQLVPGTTLYGCLDDAAGAIAELRRQGVRLVLSDPRPARGIVEPKRPARERLATAAAEVLEAALAAAGRDLTRGGLVRALSRLSVEPPGWPALDYGRVPLTGSRDVRLVRLEPES